MADQGTAARLIEIATAELGTIEGPKDNETKYGAYTKANFQPWCGSFVNWCANEAGVKVPNTVYTPGGAAAFKKKNAWIDGDLADPEAGDIAYNKGSQRNGGQVSKKLRAYKKNPKKVQISIVGFGRPKFGGAPAAPAATKCSCCGK